MAVSIIKNRFLLSQVNAARHFRKRDLVVLGGSSSEVFDYLFGGAKKYHSFWHSGVLASHFRKQRYLDYIERILEPIDRNAIVVLVYGANDMYFNSHAILQRGESLDTDRLLSDALAGLGFLERFILNLGFKDVYNIFPNPLPPIPNSYFRHSFPEFFAQNKSIELSVLAQLYLTLEQKALTRLPAIKIAHEFIDDSSYPFAAAPYCRQQDDHHLDYIRTQHAVWQKIRHISGILKPVFPLHHALYGFVERDFEEHVGKGMPPQTNFGSRYPQPLRQKKGLIAGAGALRASQ